MKLLKRAKSWWQGAGFKYQDPPFPPGPKAEGMGGFYERLDIHNRNRNQYIKEWLATYKKPGKEIIYEKFIGIIGSPGALFFGACELLHQTITGKSLVPTPGAIPGMWFLIILGNVLFYLR